MEDLLMKKTVVALLMALSVFTCSSMVSQAVVCADSPDEIHHYVDHRGLNAGYEEPAGTHMHLTGVEADGTEEYKICYLTDRYEYCDVICHYCKVSEVGKRHSHKTSTAHKINN